MQPPTPPQLPCCRPVSAKEGMAPSLLIPTASYPGTKWPQQRGQPVTETMQPPSVTTQCGKQPEGKDLGPFQTGNWILVPLTSVKTW